MVWEMLRGDVIDGFLNTFAFFKILLRAIIFSLIILLLLIHPETTIYNVNDVGCRTIL